MNEPATCIRGDTSKMVLRFRVRRALNGHNGRWRVELVDKLGFVHFETALRFHDREQSETYIENLAPLIENGFVSKAKAVSVLAPDVDNELEVDRAVNRVLKHMVRTFEPIVLCLLLAPLLAFGQGAVTTVTIPEGSQVVVVRVSKNAPTNGVVALAPPRPPPPTPNSVQMRLAAQLARGKAAPWTQRFIVTKVEESALSRVEDDDAAPVFSTNYLVTVVPLAANETNAPVVWGTVKTKQLRFWTSRPTKKGDEFEFFPTP